jgi:hypothetical protein
MEPEVLETAETLESVEIKQSEQNTPEATAADGGVDKEKQVEQPAKTFTQAEVDAIVQKRLLKTERRIHREIEGKLREQVTAVPPKREAFGSDEEFSQADIDHKAELKARELVQQRERQNTVEKQREAFEERAEKVHERYPDFQAVVSNPALPINEGMADFISDSEHGPDVAYFLGKNPGKAYEISQLSPMKAARELVRIEAEIAAKPKATPSKAPEPISPVGTRGKSSTSSLPSDADDTETWMRKERERIAKRR